MELAATLAVIAICAAVGVPALRAFVLQHRAFAAMSGIVAHLANARTAAIVHNRSVVVCPASNAQGCDDGTDWSRGWIAFFDPDGNRKPEGPGDVIAAEQASSGSRLRVLTSSGRPRIRYLPDGRSAGTNATFELCGADGRPLGAVIINNTGRVRTERRTKPGSCAD